MQRQLAEAQERALQQEKKQQAEAQEQAQLDKHKQVVHAMLCGIVRVRSKMTTAPPIVVLCKTWCVCTA
eukprot:6346109-Amphidinium_carterae.1